MKMGAPAAVNRALEALSDPSTELGRLLDDDVLMPMLRAQRELEAAEVAAARLAWG
jgi:hypothetical protein